MHVRITVAARIVVIAATQVSIMHSSEKYCGIGKSGIVEPIENLPVGEGRAECALTSVCRLAVVDSSRSAPPTSEFASAATSLLPILEIVAIKNILFFRKSVSMDIFTKRDKLT